MNNLASQNYAPIFIVGTPRSGTTLAANILGRHSRIFIPGETHFFDDVYARRTELGEPDEPESMDRILERLSNLYGRYYELPDQERVERLFSRKRVIEGLRRHCETYRDVLDRFMEMQMDDEGKTRWGNHAPRDLFNVRDILSFYPNAKFVVCVRDPRAFLFSYKGKWKVTGEEHVERLRKLYHPVVTSLLWKSSMKMLPQIMQEVGEQNRSVIRYEDLVQSPVEVVKKICDLIGEEFEPGMLTIDSHNSSYGAEGGSIFTSSIDRWRKFLSPEEIQVVQMLVGTELINLGYEKVKVRSRLNRLLLLFMSTPLALLRALHANRLIRGPLFPYLFRRLRSLIGSSSRATHKV